VVQEHPPLAPPSEVHVRSHHVELGLEPTWHSGNPDDWALGLNVGYCLRIFWTDVHNLATPRQVLTGPYVRSEFELPFLERFLLRVGPWAERYSWPGLNLPRVCAVPDARRAFSEVFRHAACVCPARAPVNYGPSKARSISATVSGCSK
jgi:hypothetical protein